MLRLGLALSLVAFQAMSGGAPELRINEIRIDQIGTDNDEYFELSGPPGASLEGLAYLVIGDGGPEVGSGVIEEVTHLDGEALSNEGFFVVAESTFTLGTADLVVDLNFENSDNTTHLLVEGFTGANGNDLDTNNDGVLDVTPWTAIVDLVALVEEPNPPANTEYHYGPPKVGPDNVGAPGYVRRCSDRWGVGRNAPLGAQDTPGAANDCLLFHSGDCGDAATLIHNIQGSGASSPIEGATEVMIEGVVVGDFQDNVFEWGGFYLQEEDADADSDPMTSEGLFVYTGGSNLGFSVGDKVRVQGEITEFFGLTEMTNVTLSKVCSSDELLPTATTIDLPLADLAEWERYEGMIVHIPETLTVTDSFALGRFGEAHLSADGRLSKPTNVTDPGEAANALASSNDLRRIILDDGSPLQNPDPAIPPIPRLAEGETLRAGDTIGGLSGILDFRAGQYRLQPIGPLEFEAANPRPASPPSVEGALKVASFNLNNFFTTLDSGAAVCGPAANLLCRGANSAAELARQRDKLLAALLGLNADILGLLEIENNATTAILNLVDSLNAILGTGMYAYIDTGTIGTDAIRSALIYKPAKVGPVGSHAVLDSSVDSRFIDTLNRPSLAQTFEEVVSGERLTVAINHFKSKSSPCDTVGDPDTGDGQENCNLTRTNAAMALVDWLATDPTGSADPDFLILGDLNSYSREDPVAAIEDAGYIDAIAAFVDSGAYTFVIDGEAGALDHALASSSLFLQMSGAAQWHINADEPAAFDYNTEFNHASYYRPDPFRSSDHDPLLLGFSLGVPPTETPTATPTRTSTPTPTATATSTPTQTASSTSTPTNTSTPILTSAPSSTPTVTPTSEPTATATQTPTRTRTLTPTPTPTRSPTATPTRNGPLIDFDLLLINQVLDEEFADLGVRFHGTARVMNTASAPSSPYVIRNEGDAITATFLDPRSGESGATRFVGFKKPAGVLPGTTFEFYDANETLLGRQVALAIAQERFAFHHGGIARLVCRPVAQGALAAIDDLEFDTPNQSSDLDQDGDGAVNAKDLLILLEKIKAGLEDYRILFKISPTWNTE